MSLYGGSVVSRLSKRSAIRDTSQLAVHLSNDNAMRRLLRDGVGINEVQKKYLSLCYSARPAVRPNKDVAQGLGAGELVWNLTVCEKQETVVIASLLTTKEAHKELRSLVISADAAGCSSVRKRAGMATNAARRGSVGSRGGTRELAMEKDPVGQVELYVALCKALPRLGALRSLELEGLSKAFGKSGEGAARLARGLAGNSKLKSLSVRRVSLTSSRALGALCAAISKHPSLVTLSLGCCGLAGEPSGRLVSSVIRAHAARREGMVWSSGLRRPPGVVGHTATAAPRWISTAGCLAVDLSGNRLGDAGVHAVARGLQSDSWLLGLNLADNGVTDRGAALMSVCLQHNATLCALVLDGNQDIGRDAERRLTEELETRSVMPEAVLEEPEVVLTLASWGFSAHAGSEGNLPPPPAPGVAGSDSAVSEISQEAFDGGDGYPGRHAASNMSGVTTTGVRPKTPAERKEDMVREFRRWAGYTPCSKQGITPATAAAAGPFAAAPLGASPPGLEATAAHRGQRARGRRPSTSVLLREEGARSPPLALAVQGDHEASSGSSGGRGRPRARSLSSRSMPRAASEGSSSGAGGGRRSAKRNKSSGPFGRAARERQHAQRSAPGGGTPYGTGGARSSPQPKTPWGVGPIKGEARERAQAWANANLVVRSSSRSSRRRARAASRRGHGGSSGCCGGRRKVGTGSAKSIVSGTRRAAAGGRAAGGRHVPEARSTRRERAAERAPLASSALDVTWEVLDAEGYPKLTPRQRRKLFPMDEEDEYGEADEADETDEADEVDEAKRPAVSLPSGAPRGDEGGGGSGGRTDRVVEMLASLEKAVMDVCKDMWRLEDKVESSERLTQSGGSERFRGGSIAVDGSSGREEQEQGTSDGDGEENDDVGVGGRDEVAAQVEACLREMWDSRSMSMSPRGSAGGTAAAEAMDDGTASSRSSNSSSSGSGSGSKIGNMELANSASHGDEGPEENEGERAQEFRTHAALLLGADGGRVSCGRCMGREEAAARPQGAEAGIGAHGPQHQTQDDEEGEEAESTFRGKHHEQHQQQQQQEEEEEEEEEDLAKREGAGGSADEGTGSDGGRWGAAATDDESEDEDGDGDGKGWCEEEGQGGGEGGSPGGRQRRRGGDGDEFVGISAPPSPLLDDLLYVEDLVGLGEEGEGDGGEDSEDGNGD